MPSFLTNVLQPGPALVPLDVFFRLVIAALLGGVLLEGSDLSILVNLPAAVLVFGGFWGFWGIFFAIPLATVVQSILKAWPRPVL